MTKGTGCAALFALALFVSYVIVAGVVLAFMSAIL